MKSYNNNFRKIDKYEIEKHPFEEFIPPSAKYLVIGTFPTHKDNFRFNFFYSGKDNLFWEIIESVFDYNFVYKEGEKAKSERELFLTTKLIGVTDMHELCYRKNNASTDENLFPIVLKDLFTLLDNNDSIENLILTSRTQVIGALGLLQTYFLQNNLLLGELTKRQDKILEGDFMHKGKKIKLLVPYSPSPRIIREGRTTMNELISMYSFCLKV